MALTANALAKRLNCAWATVRKAIARGELKAVFDRERRAWLIEDGRELVFFKMRLASLHATRQQRRERMQALWKLGRLKPRGRQKVAVQVVMKRPSMVVIGEGVMQRSRPITWRESEGIASCPICGSVLKVR